MWGVTMMRNVGRALIPLGLLSCLFTATCRSPSGPDRIPVVQLLAPSASIAVGDTLRVTLLPVLPPGYVPPVTWSSSDPAVASVSSTGASSARVDGLQAGGTVIRAAGDGARDSLFLTVTSGGS